MKYKYEPDYVVHPGESLKAFVEAKGLSELEVCSLLGSEVVGVLYLRSSLTPELALKIKSELGGPPSSFWLNLQENYDNSKK